MLCRPGAMPHRGAGGGRPAHLADAGEEDLARWRHARAFLARAEAIEPMLFAPQAELHCDLLEFDRPDHDAALGWFLSGGAAEEAQRLAAALYFFWYTRGWFVTGLRWLRATLAAEAQVEPLVRLRARGRAGAAGLHRR